MTRPSAERVRELFRYDGEHLIALTQRSRRIRVGEPAGGLTSRGYVRVRVDGGRYFEHVLVWLHVTGEWPHQGIDHRNGNPADNRFDNLRLATQSQNSMNRRRRSNNTLGFKGVMKVQRGRFYAYIWDGKRRVMVGAGDTPEEAHEVYCTAARERFGEFANGG
jgi:hypothetical protein